MSRNNIESSEGSGMSVELPIKVIKFKYLVFEMKIAFLAL